MASRLGAVNPERGAYAHHPPLIYLETAAAEAVGNSSRAATRAPAWLGSLAALWLLWVLLRDQGFSQGFAALGVVAAATTPMFLVYGGMLDTPIVALPFALGVLICWFRAMAGRRVRPWLLASVMVLAALASWQGLLTAAVVAGWGAWGLLRKRDFRSLRIAAIGGFAIGMVALAGWMFWAYDGSLKAVTDVFVYRTGRSGGTLPSLADQARRQWDVHSDLFGVSLIALCLVGIASGLRTGGARRHLALVTLALTVPYVVALAGGAYIHDYWDYWFLLPVAVGVTMAAEAAASLIGRRAPGLAPTTGPGAPAALVVGLGLLYRLVIVGAFFQSPPSAQEAIDQGMVAAAPLERAGYPTNQATAWYAGYIGDPPSWLSYATRRPVERIGSPQAMANVPAGDAIFVGYVVCSDDGEPTKKYSLEPVTQLKSNPRLVFCPG